MSPSGVVSVSIHLNGGDSAVCHIKQMGDRPDESDDMLIAPDVMMWCPDSFMFSGWVTNL